MTTLIWLLIWGLCGVLTYGAVFAYCQGRWPEIAKASHDADARFALKTSLFGPIGLLVFLSIVGPAGFRYGFKWR